MDSYPITDDVYVVETPSGARITHNPKGGTPRLMPLEDAEVDMTIAVLERIKALRPVRNLDRAIASLTQAESWIEEAFPASKPYFIESVLRDLVTARERLAMEKISAASVVPETPVPTVVPVSADVKETTRG